MSFEFERIDYRKDLNPKQKENYNFQKISAVLADYGFVTLRLSDDWRGADFIALHTSGKSLQVQLKSRLTFLKIYEDRDDLYVVFPLGKEWYLYNHRELLNKVLKATNIGATKSWKEKGLYSIGKPGAMYLELLKDYRLDKSEAVGIAD